MSSSDTRASLTKPRVSRRSFLHFSAACAAGAGVGGAVAPSRGRVVSRPAAGRGGSAGKARNVIFMVADGMSLGTLTLADMVRRRRENRPSNWVELFSRPGVRRGLYETSSADSLVTDSAAAATAWGSGVRVNNSCLNVTPDGRQTMPILVQASQAGKATGLVTTTRITHATPASFVANSPRRDWEGPIARQMLERRVDVLLGGGRRHFDERTMEGYDVPILSTRAELLAALDRPPERMLGLFAPKHMPFMLDKPETTPTLAEMTRAALARLRSAPDGFVMQVEGGRVDHAAHSNDAPSLVAEQLAFDDAIAEALAFIDDGRRDDTLLIVTADHGNANPGLTLYGDAGARGLDLLGRAKHSFDWVYDVLTQTPARERADRLPELVREGFGIELSPEERSLAAEALAGKRVACFSAMCGMMSVVGGLLANHYGVSFVSGNHTADRVEVTALGPGAEDLPPVGHNQDLHGLMVASLGLAPGKPLPDMLEPMRLPEPPEPD